MTQQFFSLLCDETAPEEYLLPPGFTGVLWRPSWRHAIPPEQPLMPFAVWWGFHHARIFTNQDYSVLMIRDSAHIVHRSCIFPGYFRFPFMKEDDLQIGNTWTAPTCRGLGLATIGLREAIRLRWRSGRRFWYLTESDNLASIRVAENAGLQLVGEGRRTLRCGLRLLGAFELDRSTTTAFGSTLTL